jgi:hypothetical protein
MSDDHGSQLPPPPPPPAADQVGFLRRNRTAVIIVAVGLVVLALVLGSLQSKDEPTEPGRRMSLTEAVCDMLNDGDSPDFALRVARDLAADHPATFDDPDSAARLALAQAQGQGCGP